LGNRIQIKWKGGNNKIVAKKRVEKFLIGAMAHCLDCDWEEEGYRVAQKEARRHAIKTGHTVHVETVYSQTYNPKKEESNET